MKNVRLDTLSHWEDGVVGSDEAKGLICLPEARKRTQMEVLKRPLRYQISPFKPPRNQWRKQSINGVRSKSPRGARLPLFSFFSEHSLTDCS